MLLQWRRRTDIVAMDPGSWLCLCRRDFYWVQWGRRVSVRRRPAVFTSSAALRDSESTSRSTTSVGILHQCVCIPWRCDRSNDNADMRFSGRSRLVANADVDHYSYLYTFIVPYSLVLFLFIFFKFWCCVIDYLSPLERTLFASTSHRINMISFFSVINVK